MKAQIHEHTLDTGRITLNYAEIPASGPPLLLLHGGSARWQAFDAILTDLASSYHIFAPDFRGHGNSAWAPGTYRLQDYAEDTIAFMQQVLTEPAFLFGHSLGGMVALLVAAHYPAGVRAVAVGDGLLSADSWYTLLDATRERLTAWRDLAGRQKPLADLIESVKESPTELPGQAEPVPLRQVVGEDSPLFEWLATNLYHNDPDMLSALLERFETTAAGYEMESVLPAIEAPVLLLQADPTSGGLMTDDEVTAALPLLTQPHHVKLEGVSHVLHNEQPEAVLEAVERFFQACT